jgi:hypothetical protein
MSALPPKPTFIAASGMSALGQKRTCAAQNAMSALAPIATAKADSRERPCPLSPKSGHGRCNSPCLLWANSDIAGLLDDLVGASQQRGWNVDANRFGSLQIYDELELSR